MKRLLMLMMITVMTVGTLGCGSSRSCCSGGRLFNWSGFRGDPCTQCTQAPTCGCPAPVYSQSISAYDGCGSCGSCGGFAGSASFGGCPSCGGMSAGVYPGMDLTPGTMIPGQGMIIDNSQQIPVLPGPATNRGPQTIPVPQNNTPGPAGNN